MAELRRFAGHRLALAGLAVLGVIVVASLFAHPPGPGAPGRPYQPPSLAHPMGTNQLGDDLSALVLRGARRSTEVGVLVAALSTAFGVAVGALAGFYRGWVDAALARLVDLALTIPVLAVLLVLAGRLRSHRTSWVAIAVVISVVTWPGIARVVRAVFVSMSERGFVEAAQSTGASDARIILRHLVPNAVGPIVVIATLTVASGILAEAALSFLGFGTTGVDASLGRLVSEGQSAGVAAPFYFPGGMLLLICLCVNFVGEGLRETIDPHGYARRVRRER